MTCALEWPERQHVDRVRQRLERPAALLMVDARQTAMTVGIVSECDTHAGLIGGDWCLATCAPRPIRSTSAGWHQIIGHNFPFRLAPSPASHEDNPPPIKLRPAACGRSASFSGNSGECRLPFLLFQTMKVGGFATAVCRLAAMSARLNVEPHVAKTAAGFHFAEARRRLQEPKHTGGEQPVQPLQGRAT
jgi:hypothetical protein